MKNWSHEYRLLAQKILTDGKITTEELLKMLDEDGVNPVLTSYLAVLHCRKVDKKSSPELTISEVSSRINKATVAIKAEFDRAKKNGEKISLNTAAKRAASRPDSEMKTNTLKRYFLFNPYNSLLK